MTELMGVRAEIWPLAADEIGIWLLSGDDAWRTAPISSDSEPHAEVELHLLSNGAHAGLRFLHSTSWRVDGPHVILSYVTIIAVDDLIRAVWPNAAPITQQLINTVGKPGPGPTTEVPTPRYIDVLLHGLRHVRFLLDTDSAAKDALDSHWKRHLEALTPALAGMYHADELPAIETGSLGKLIEP
jgi:hypothetical protein